MFRITGNLANFRKLIHHYHHHIRVPIANVSYPPRDYTPQEREPCPPPPQEPPPKPRDDSVFWGAMAVVVITAGFAVYAKNSPEVRDWLVIQAPWFDDLIAVVYQENMTYGQFAWKCVEDVKTYINNIVNDDKPKTCSMDENTAKISLSDNSMVAVECDGPDSTCPTADPVPVMTKNICEVVECVRDRADTALSNYQAAISACTSYNKNVEEAMKNFTITSGKDLPNQMAERKKIVNKSVAVAEEATLDLDELIRFIECGVQASKEDIDNVMQMINDYQQKIKVSSIKFQLVNEKSSMLDQLWMKVECGIQKYTQETETMFPEVRYAQNKLQMTGDLDLLLHHTFRYVQMLKKELDEVGAGITDKVDRGLDTLPQGEKKKQRDALIGSTIQQRRAEMNKEYQDRYDELVKKNEAILSESLKDQLERHQESLETKLQQRDDEANAKLNKMVTEKVAFEKNVIKHQLEDMAFKLKLVEDKLNRSLKAEHDAKRSQELWNAGSALLAATKKGENYVKVNKELRAIEKASGEGDELVTSVLKAIPDSVREKGVVPESVLKKRYHKMERTALRVALVEQDGGPLPVYFLSWLQSVLLFMKISGIPQEEADKPGSEPINPDLDTFDLLQRARYWMGRGNIAAAIRYVGALEGASLEAARPWHEAAKAHLETKQAAEAVLAHAASLGLQYMWGMLFILTLIVFGLWAWSRRKNSSNEPPLHPGALPLIGHAHRLIGDSAELWKRLIELADTCSGVGGVIAGEIGPRTVYVLTDPEDCMTVSNACLEKDGFYEFAKPWLGEGLVTGTLSIWKVHRKLLNPAFSQVVLDGFLELLNRQARRLVKDLSVEVGKGPFDHWVYTRHNAIETICLTALGVDYSDKTILTAEYVQATEQILNVFVERFQKFWWHNNFLYEFSNLKKKQDELLKILHHMSNTVLKKRKAEYLKNRNTGTEMEKPTITGVKFKPFMDLLLELSIEKGAFNDQEIREHVDTMIIGGHDTSASVLMFSLLLIGSYPHVQERIFEELREVFGNDDRDATKQDLSRLVYTEAVLKESMRIYPIVPVIARTLDKDVKLRNCTLTSGRTCFMLVCGIHRHGTWGPDADVFRPERWLDLATLPEHPGAFAAFSMGRRICIGKSYAYMSMKTVLAHVLRHYKVKGDHRKMDLKIDVMLKPVSGYYISIEKRTDRN